MSLLRITLFGMNAPAGRIGVLNLGKALPPVGRGGPGLDTLKRSIIVIKRERNPPISITKSFQFFDGKCKNLWYI